ncbi:hypothetical protein 15570_00005 [Lokiarchaeota virus WyrdV1]|nr:hypothetical protein 15570_00005 [Lokiarchaeota virus WyrdV1]
MVGFKKLKVRLSERNERILREMWQFTPTDYTFEVFVNNWIRVQLSKAR